MAHPSPPSLVSLLLLSLSLASSAAAFAHSPSSNRATRLVPNRYIIEVDASAATLAKRGLSPFAILDRTLAAVKTHGIPYRLRHSFEDLPDVFHGASIDVDEGTTLEDLASIDGVKNVWPVQLLSRPVAPIAEDGGAFSSSTYANLSALLASPSPPASAYTGETYYPHVQTGVAALHNSGYLGAGVKIAVLDDGVDYTNPLLGSCFGTGCHISFGYAFVDDSYTGVETPVASADPYSSCASHGTHVTGIIGALANELGFSGVAPAATLGHYRVLGCQGDVGEDILVAALMRAYMDGVQVISISIAGGIGWTDLTPSQILSEHLSSLGVHMVAGGGNEQTEGLFFTDTPAATLQGTVVGAVDTLDLPAYNAILSGGRDPLPYTSPTPLSNVTGTLSVYFTSTNSSLANDACTALPASTPDLSNSVVVVQRGTCDFVTKIKNVAAAGAKVVFVYNSAGSLSIPQLSTGTPSLGGVASLRREEGLKLLSYYLADPTGLTITFPFSKLVPGVVDNVSGGTVSYYSNWGPTNELYMYPTIVAPGTNILSTVPGGVGLMRGSSMSTPYHAGSVALLLSARQADNLTPAQVKSIFQTTNSLAPVDYGETTLAPVILQGAGVINVNKAVAARTFVSPSQILLNDTQYLNSSQKITLTNRNSFATTYQFSWSNAIGVVTYDDGASVDIIPSPTPDPIDVAALRVAFSSRSITVAAKSSATITATVSPPNLTAAQRDKFPFYSGWIRISGVGQGAGKGRTEAYTVPFFGLAARMYDMPVIDTTDQTLGAFLPFMAVEDINVGSATYSDSEIPTVFWRLGAGTRRLNLDLVAANIDFTSTIPSVTNNFRLFKRSASEVTKRATPTLYADVPILGNVYTPSEAPARDYLLNFGGSFSDYEIAFNGTYTSASGKAATVSTGTSYRLLLRALKITGNPLLSADYESWLSPTFSFSSIA